MIENPKMTIRLLQYINDTPASRMDINHVEKGFKTTPKERIHYHLWCLGQHGLVEGKFLIKIRNKTLPSFQIKIKGLTLKGHNYLEDSKSVEWSRATDELSSKGLAITTEGMIKVMSKLSKPKSMEIHGFDIEVDGKDKYIIVKTSDGEFFIDHNSFCYDIQPPVASCNIQRIVKMKGEGMEGFVILVKPYAGISPYYFYEENDFKKQINRLLMK